jgi:hypothetical protein
MGSGPRKHSSGWEPTSSWPRATPGGSATPSRTSRGPSSSTTLRPKTPSALEVWESLTGWYTTKTGVDNSTLLRPIGEAPYAFVNYVRLPRRPVRFMLDQLTRPSFYTFVRPKLRANNMVAFPLLCEAV